MRIVDNGTALTVWLSARDTKDWATRPGKRWPCSRLAGRRLCATFDRSGLVDLTVDGGDAPDDWDANEFNAVVADYVGTRIGPDHPCHYVIVGQFEEGASR